jgi:hypothetical protein
MKNKLISLTIIVVALVFTAGILGYHVGVKTSQSAAVSGVSKHLDETSPLAAAESSSEPALMVTQSSSSASLTVSENLTTQFYSWYIDCMKVKGGCDYKTRPEIDEPTLTAKIKSQDITGYDPLLCAQNIPLSFRVDHETNDTPNNTSVYLIESFSEDQIQLIVETEQKENQWKIANVICPRP